MEQSGSGGRAGIEPELAADQKAVVGHVHTVLETSGGDVMSDLLELLELLSTDKVADAIVIAVYSELLLGADSFEHSKTSF